MAGVVEKLKEEWLQDPTAQGESAWAFANWVYKRQQKEILYLMGEIEKADSALRAISEIKKIIKKVQK
jgi:hypothetical protein